MRVPELRHPAFHMTGTPEQQIQELKSRPGWSEAPALIVVIGDGRRQWPRSWEAHVRPPCLASDRWSRQHVHAYSPGSRFPGAGHQWVTVHIEDGFKRILDVPDVMNVFTIIPVVIRCSAEKRHAPSTGQPDPPKSIRPRQVRFQSADDRKHRKAAAGTKPKYSESRGE